MCELYDTTISDFTLDRWVISDEDRKSVLYHFFSQEITADYAHLSLHLVKSSDTGDQLQYYGNELVSLGIFYQNYKDAIKEDNGRVLTYRMYL